MNTHIQFGWRVPDYPLDGSSPQVFRDQVVTYLDALRDRFASFWVADHFVPWDSRQDPATDTYEAWTTTTYLAALFPELLAGNIVLSQSYRPPALLAKMAATLQALTRGRYILGIGAGWKQDEYEAYGYEFPSAATRIHQLDEAVRIIRLMWTEPKATFHGNYYHIDEAINEPKPVPAPPIMIGGGGKKLTLKVVAEQADWWNVPGSPPEEYEDLLNVLRGHCQAAGRNYDEIVKTWATDCVAVGRTKEEAGRIAQSSPFGSPEGTLIGTPDEVTRQIERYARLGVQHFMLRFADFPNPDGAMLFFETVAPRF
ncbi:MAG: LLM class flavin-dependent oxidoreductase [Omnitrophica WOR_2 bacterium]